MSRHANLPYHLYVKVSNEFLQARENLKYYKRGDVVYWEEA